MAARPATSSAPRTLGSGPPARNAATIITAAAPRPSSAGGVAAGPAAVAAPLPLPAPSAAVMAPPPMCAREAPHLEARHTRRQDACRSPVAVLGRPVFAASSSSSARLSGQALATAKAASTGRAHPPPPPPRPASASSNSLPGARIEDGSVRVDMARRERPNSLGRGGVSSATSVESWEAASPSSSVRRGSHGDASLCRRRQAPDVVEDGQPTAPPNRACRGSRAPSDPLMDASLAGASGRDSPSSESSGGVASSRRAATASQGNATPDRLARLSPAARQAGSASVPPQLVVAFAANLADCKLQAGPAAAPHDLPRPNAEALPQQSPVVEGIASTRARWGEESAASFGGGAASPLLGSGSRGAIGDRSPVAALSTRGTTGPPDRPRPALSAAVPSLAGSAGTALASPAGDLVAEGGFGDGSTNPSPGDRAPRAALAPDAMLLIMAAPTLRHPPQPPRLAHRPIARPGVEGRAAAGDHARPGAAAAIRPSPHRSAPWQAENSDGRFPLADSVRSIPPLSVPPSNRAGSRAQSPRDSHRRPASRGSAAREYAARHGQQAAYEREADPRSGAAPGPDREQPRLLLPTQAVSASRSPVPPNLGTASRAAAAGSAASLSDASDLSDVGAGRSRGLARAAAGSAGLRAAPSSSRGSASPRSALSAEGATGPGAGRRLPFHGRPSFAPAEDAATHASFGLGNAAPAERASPFAAARPDSAAAAAFSAASSASRARTPDRLQGLQAPVSVSSAAWARDRLTRAAVVSASLALERQPVAQPGASLRWATAWPGHAPRPDFAPCAPAVALAPAGQLAAESRALTPRASHRASVSPVASPRASAAAAAAADTAPAPAAFPVQASRTRLVGLEAALPPAEARPSVAQGTAQIGALAPSLRPRAGSEVASDGSRLSE